VRSPPSTVTLPVHRSTQPCSPCGAEPDAASVHPLLRACADRQLGLFTTSDAMRAGYLRKEVDSSCRSGRWVRLRRGVHISAGELAEHERHGRRHRIDCLAVLLALDRPAAAVSHTSAARLWGFPVRRDLDRIVRLTDPGEWRRGRDFVVTSAPLEEHERADAGPVPLTSAPRTLVDCARQWRLEDAVVAMDAALLAGHVSRSDLDAAAARADHWPGAAAARRAVGLTDGRAESPLETRGRLRIVGSGFPLPELQVEIRTAGRLLGVVDA